MRKIKYILIDSETEARSSKFGHRGKSDIIHQPSNILSYHYAVNSDGLILKPTDVSLPAHLDIGTSSSTACNLERRALHALNRCSIAIRFDGSLKPGTWNLELKAKLLLLLVDLRSHFPQAKILGVSEIDYRELYHRNIIVSDAMNALRKELSNYT